MKNYTLKIIVLSLSAIVICSSVSFAIRVQGTNTTPQTPRGNPTPPKPTGKLQIGCGKCDGSEVLYIVNDGGGLCLDADIDTRTKDGGKVQVWGCAPKLPDPQRWSFQKPVTTRGITTNQIVNGGGTKCLDVDTGNGVKVQVWKCTGAPEQRWFFRGSELVNQLNGKCLEVASAAIHTVGAIVRASECNKQPAQQWHTVK
jgi:hypothetical protein